jgi:hypothetical protein
VIGILGMGFWMDPTLQPMRASILLPVAVTLGGLGLLLFPLFTTGTTRSAGCSWRRSASSARCSPPTPRPRAVDGVRSEYVTPLPAAFIPVALGTGVFADASAPAAAAAQSRLCLGTCGRDLRPWSR